MRYGRAFRAFALVALIAAIGVGLSACGGGSGSDKKSSQDIFLEAMLLIDQLENTDVTAPGDPTYNDIGGSGTTNAFRDSKVLFKFNTAVDFDSVTSRTIRVGIPTSGNLLVEAQGRFEPVAKKPNWILFNPTYQTAYDASDPSRPPDNPFGFDGNAVFYVEIPAVGDRPNVITNTSGDPIIKPYQGEFATTDDYIQTYTQPDIVETNPLDGSIEVDATADVDLTFSEPMKPSSFRLGDSVIVRNLDTGRDVLGTLRFSSDAKTVSFRPVFGYGPGPYDIFVRVKTDVTNLSGNHIPKEVRIQFRTEKDDNVATLIDITESFDTNDYEDTDFDTNEALAAWNSGAASGRLAGLYATGTSTIKTTANYLYPPWAWGTNYPGQFQCFWKATTTEVGATPRTITGFSWYYQASQAAATVTAVTINLGHHYPGTSGSNGLSTTLPSNFSDIPITVVANQATYAIPLNTATGSWLAGPPFTRNFKFNGSDNLLFELFCTTDVNGLTNRIINGAWGFGNDTLVRCAMTQPSWWGGGANTTYQYIFDARFSWLVSSAEAQSLFYDTSVKSPTFLSALIDPAISEQPTGTTTLVYYQGAPDDVDDPGSADVQGASEWFDDLTKITGYRYVRFNILMHANTTTNQVPVYDSMTFPYYFF